MKTKITELLGIEYPIVQGAMAWIAEHHLAAAVSKAGGLGIIAGGAAPVDYIREEIHKARAITDKPLGMNIMLLSPNADDLAQLAIDEKIEVLTTGAGNPGKYIADWKNAGLKGYADRRFRCTGKAHGARRCRCGYRRGYGRRRPHR